MPSNGGRYVIRDGKRELVQRTKPTATKYAKAPNSNPATAPVKNEKAAHKATKSAMQEVKDNE
jgi:hypothetical protein|tara:strand:- start:57014 stop:57202 length:189 start_codon:yes stop_codon:yes gene_type:complete